MRTLTKDMREGFHLATYSAAIGYCQSTPPFEIGPGFKNPMSDPPRYISLPDGTKTTVHGRPDGRPRLRTVESALPGKSTLQLRGRVVVEFSIKSANFVVRQERQIKAKTIQCR